jgi:hypothetical protein
MSGQSQAGDTGTAPRDAAPPPRNAKGPTAVSPLLNLLQRLGGAFAMSLFHTSYSRSTPRPSRGTPSVYPTQGRQ